MVVHFPRHELLVSGRVVFLVRTLKTGTLDENGHPLEISHFFFQTPHFPWRDTLSPIIMVPWENHSKWKETNIGDTPLFHGTMIMGGRVLPKESEEFSMVPLTLCWLISTMTRFGGGFWMKRKKTWEFKGTPPMPPPPRGWWWLYNNP